MVTGFWNRGRTERRGNISMSKILNEIPAGWKPLEGANAPKGYKRIWNVKSRFGPRYETALVPSEVAYEWNKVRGRCFNGFERDRDG